MACPHPPDHSLTRTARPATGRGRDTAHQLVTVVCSWSVEGLDLGADSSRPRSRRDHCSAPPAAATHASTGRSFRPHISSTVFAVTLAAADRPGPPGSAPRRSGRCNREHDHAESLRAGVPDRFTSRNALVTARAASTEPNLTPVCALAAGCLHPARGRSRLSASPPHRPREADGTARRRGHGRWPSASTRRRAASLRDDDRSPSVVRVLPTSGALAALTGSRTTCADHH